MEVFVSNEKKIIKILGKQIDINKINNPVLKQILNENIKQIGEKYFLKGSIDLYHTEYCENDCEYHENVFYYRNINKYYPNLTFENSGIKFNDLEDYLESNINK